MHFSHILMDLSDYSRSVELTKDTKLDSAFAGWLTGGQSLVLRCKWFHFTYAKAKMLLSAAALSKVHDVQGG